MATCVSNMKALAVCMAGNHNLLGGAYPILPTCLGEL